jgi:hypothetical protein
VLLRRVAAPEVAAYRPLIREATFGNSVEKRALDERDTYGKAFIQVGDIWTKNPGCERHDGDRYSAAGETSSVPLVE